MQYELNIIELVSGDGSRMCIIKGRIRAVLKLWDKKGEEYGIRI